MEADSYFEKQPHTRADHLVAAGVLPHEDDGTQRALTPSFYESYQSLRQNMSYRGLTEIQVQDLQRHIWRGPNEPRPQPHDMEQVLVNALNGGSHAFGQTYFFRAVSNIVMLLASSAIRSRRISWNEVVRAVSNRSCTSASTMMFTFAFVYKFIFHALRLADGHTRRYHVITAGFLSGLGSLFETRGRRVALGQFFLVRGVQGYLNMLKHRGHFSFPHWDVVVFGLSCGQIMYAFVMAPHTLSKSYHRWIAGTGNISLPALKSAAELAQRHVPPSDKPMNAGLYYFGQPTQKHRADIEAILTNIHAHHPVSHVIPCALMHPLHDSCASVFPHRVLFAMRGMFPMYLAINSIPRLVLARRKVLKDPVMYLRNSAIATLRSCLFIGFFAALFQFAVCSVNNLGLLIPVVGRLLATSRAFSHIAIWIAGTSPGLSLFFEQKNRRADLAVYVLPRALDSLWKTLKPDWLLPRNVNGSVALNCIATSFLMYTFHYEPLRLSRLVRVILYQALGHV